MNHSIYSPSSSNRWLNCHGSVKLIQTCPQMDSHPSAIEGTHAHSLAEMCFETGVSAYHFIDEQTPTEHVVDKTMAKHVQTYLDYVNLIRFKKCGTIVVEQQLSVKSIDARLFGTSDVILITDKSDLHVFDFKYGKWPVEVEGNTQLMIYAIGALECMGLPKRAVTAHICQPRAKHRDGINRSAIYSIEELRSLERDIANAIKESDKPEPELADGEHCRFCPAELICPKLNSLGRIVQV